MAKTITALNERVVGLSKDVRRFNSDVFYEEKDLSEQREIVLNKVTELQWILIDVDTIIGREEGSNESVRALQMELSNLTDMVQNAKDPEDQEKVIAAMRSVAKLSQSVIRDLYSAARLS